MLFKVCPFIRFSLYKGQTLQGPVRVEGEERGPPGARRIGAHQVLGQVGLVYDGASAFMRVRIFRYHLY